MKDEEDGIEIPIHPDFWRELKPLPPPMCFWCLKDIHEDPLYLSNDVEVHAHCAREAADRMGMTIKLEPSEMTDEEFRKLIDNVKALASKPRRAG